MPAIARVGDPISHGGAITGHSPDVTVDGIFAARQNDAVLCALHGAQTIVAGAPSATVDGVALARVGDPISCGAVISGGSPDSECGNGDSPMIVPVAEILGSAYSVGVNDFAVVCKSTPCTVTLLAAPGTGRTYRVKNGTSGGTVTVAGNGNTIDGQASVALGAWESVDFMYDGSEWSMA